MVIIYGYDISGAFATIMSYKTPEIPFFSNPELSYGLDAIGIAEGEHNSADHVSSMNKTKFAVSAYRDGSDEEFSGDGVNNFDYCFVATVAYGGLDRPEVKLLRLFRDKYLSKFYLGQLFISFYYKNGPVLASFIDHWLFTRELARLLLWPVVGFAWLSREISVWGSCFFLFLGLSVVLGRHKIRLLVQELGK